MESTRLMNLLVMQMVGLALCSIIIYGLRRKNNSHSSKLFSEFFIVICISFIVSLGALFPFEENILLFFVYSSDIILYTATSFLFLTMLSIYHKKEERYSFEIYYLIFSFSLILIGYIIWGSQITITDKLMYPVELVIYLVIIMVAFQFVPVYLFMIKVHYSLEDSDLRKRWRYIILGIMMLNVPLLGNLINNLNAIIPLWWTLVSVIGGIGGFIIVSIAFTKFRK